MNADNLNSDKVIASGMVNPEAAARGCGDVKDGFEHKYVLRGFACVVYISVFVIIPGGSPTQTCSPFYARTHAQKICTSSASAERGGPIEDEGGGRERGREGEREKGGGRDVLGLWS